MTPTTILRKSLVGLRQVTLSSKAVSVILAVLVMIALPVAGVFAITLNFPPTIITVPAVILLFITALVGLGCVIWAASEDSW